MFFDHEVARLRRPHLPAQLRDLGDLQPGEREEDARCCDLRQARLRSSSTWAAFSARFILLASSASIGRRCRSSTPAPSSRRSETVRKYLPLAAGLALLHGPDERRRVLLELSSSKEVLPIEAWMIEVLSTRNSTLPALIS